MPGIRFQIGDHGHCPPLDKPAGLLRPTGERSDLGSGRYRPSCDGSPEITRTDDQDPFSV